ncbi:hypothetical protein Ciccas_007766 [Cichlidogyrus casuarinus]|uniref:Ig-like domain-containing protein n=1 Tax=Cichlidogyrus casuarinus TaxID=1844966 RepID=A0ABD2Q2P0_9PLAT
MFTGLDNDEPCQVHSWGRFSVAYTPSNERVSSSPIAVYTTSQLTIRDIQYHDLSLYTCVALIDLKKEGGSQTLVQVSR